MFMCVSVYVVVYVRMLCTVCVLIFEGVQIFVDFVFAFIKNRKNLDLL